MNTNLENIEKIKKWQEEIDEKVKNKKLPPLERYSKDKSKPITDGIVDIEKFCNAKYKILWILKEARDADDEAEKIIGSGEWSLCDYLNKYMEYSEKDGKKNRTQQMIRKVSYSLLNDFLPYEDINNNIEVIDKDAEVLKSIAEININKGPGFSDSQDGEWKEKGYPHYRDIIHEQIKMINPDILIFGYTFFDELRKYCKEKYGLKEDDKTEKYKETWSYVDKNNKIYIDAYHPARRGSTVKDIEYANQIIQIVKERIEEREKQ